MDQTQTRINLEMPVYADRDAEYYRHLMRLARTERARKWAAEREAAAERRAQSWARQEGRA